MLGLTHDIGDYLDRLAREVDRVDRQRAYRLAELVFQAREADHWVFVFGNGGSGATASHFAEDLAISALPKNELCGDGKRRPRVLSLTDNTSWITALANDLTSEQVFVQPLRQFGRVGDLAIALCGSGYSPNVLRAIEWANEHGLTTFGLTGFDGGRLQDIQQEELQVPLADMGMVESIHLAVMHWVVEEIHARINRSGRYSQPANPH